MKPVHRALALVASAVVACGGVLAVVTAGTTATTPSLTLSQSTLPATGQTTITITGSGFDPTVLGTEHPLAGQPAGVYVYFAKATEACPSSYQTFLRSTLKWAAPAAQLPVVGSKGIELTASGSFTTTMVIDKAALDALPSYPDETQYGVFTVPAAGGTAPQHETFAPIAFGGSPTTPVPCSGLTPSVPRSPAPAPTGTPSASTPPTSTPPTTSAPPTTSPPTTAPAAAVQAGSLAWGFKQSFLSYIVGPIAHGTIAVAGGAAFSSNRFTFGQSSSSADANGIGTTSYTGSIHFYGHDGILDITFAEPQMRITSASSAVLSLSVNGVRNDIADVDLSKGTKTSGGGGAVGWSNAPATLTAAGSQIMSYQGSAFYQPGQALDPVTFMVGGKASVSADTAPRQVALTNPTVANTNDASAGATSARTSGDSATSTGCPITTATMTWGFKASWRAYISGNIAKGDWETAGDASYKTPNFVFNNGTGTFDGTTTTGEISFDGSIRFTGHGGMLDSTFSDVRIQFLDATRAVMLVDSESISREAAESGQNTIDAYADIQFLTLDLGAAKKSVEGSAITFTGIPAVVTTQGASAASYQAGTEFDPVTLSITAGPDCEVEAAGIARSTDGDGDANTGWIFLLVGIAVGVGATLLVRFATSHLQARRKAARAG